MMRTDDQSKNSRIQEIIKSIAVPQLEDNLLENQIEELNEIYDGDFRHSYSQILITIQNLDDSKRILLMTNIEQVLNSINGKLSLQAQKGLKKLNDHIQLDISRLNYFKKEFEKDAANLKDRIDKAQAEQSNALLKFTSLSNQISKHEKDISTVKSEHITILGIFAAIMAAGVGGFTILGNVAAMAGYISTYRFFAITAFLGFILFNVVFMLIYMISRLIGKNIYTICTDENRPPKADCIHVKEDNNDKELCRNNCCGLERVKKRLPYIFWSNLVLIVVIVFSLISEYLVMKYSLADWLIILLGFIFIELALYYGIKNSK